MSDYVKAERKAGAIFRSFMTVMLAFAVAFAFSGISAAQFAYAADATYTAKYIVPGLNPEPGDDENQIASDGEINLDDYKTKFEAKGYELESVTVGEGTPDTNLDSPVPVTDGATVTFTYALIEYTVTFDSDGGSAVDEQKVNYGEKVSKPADPEKTGYAFAGWTLDGAPYSFDSTVTGNIELKATWTINQYTVTFDSDGGSAVDEQKVNYGEKVSKPADPEKTGYAFAGWTLDGAPYSFDSTVTGNIELKAAWTLDPAVTINYTVEYVDNANKTLDTKNLTTEIATVTIGPDTINAPEGYTVSGITVTTGDKTETVTDFGPGGTFTVAENSTVTVTCTPVPVEKTVFYTVNYVGADPAPASYTRTETVEDDAEGVIAIWEEDINKTVAGYKIASVKLENGTAVKAGDEVPSGSVITVIYEKIPVKTGAWVLSGNRWWYKYSDGTWPANEWLQVNGKYYHFDSAGWMQTGWLSTNKGVNNNALDAATWFYLDGSGSAHTGWLLLGNTWYYLNTSADVEGTDLLATMVGAPAQGALTVFTVNGKEYCFAYSGAMQTGWKKISGTWFYFNGSGAMVTNGWAMSGGKWFWLSADGSMAASSWVDGDNYYVGANGAMLVGWAQLDTDGDGTKNWYCFNASGKKYANQWLLSYGKWYWMNPDGTMAESSWVDKGNYYVNASGVMVTGWNRIGTNSIGETTLDSDGEFAWYYFNASGMKTTSNWIKSGGKWYWLGADGSMVENDWVDKGNYYMDNTGIMVTGWKRIGHDSMGNATLDKQGRPAYYYFNPSGLKITNAWVQKDGQWYWFGMDGSLVQGEWVDNGKYWVNDEGVYVPGYKADPEAGTDTTE